MDLCQPYSVSAAALTLFDVIWFVGIHAVAVGTRDVGPHRHRGVCGDIIGPG